MKKKLVVTILSVLIVFTMIPITSAAVNPYGSLNNFRKTLTYDQGHFSDVKSSDWFADNVATAYEYRLMNGTSDTTYSPDISITLAMTITLAARLHQMYYSEDEIITPGWMEPWYQPYVNYAIENGIIKSWEYSSTSFNNSVSRRRFAYIMASALPPEALERINNIEMGKIPDVGQDNEFATAIYQLYNAGILTGNDEYGTFMPNSYIRRSEVAAIVTRMVDPTLRKSFKLKEPSKNELFGMFYKTNGLKITIEDGSKGGKKAVKVTVEGEEPVILSEYRETVYEKSSMEFGEYLQADAKYYGNAKRITYSLEKKSDSDLHIINLEYICDKNDKVVSDGILFMDEYFSNSDYYDAEAYVEYTSGLYKKDVLSNSSLKKFNEFIFYNNSVSGGVDRYCRSKSGELLGMRDSVQDQFDVVFYDKNYKEYYINDVLDYKVDGNLIVYNNNQDKISFNVKENTIQINNEEYKFLGESITRAAYNHYIKHSGKSNSIIKPASAYAYEENDTGFPESVRVDFYEEHEDYRERIDWYIIDVKSLMDEGYFGSSVDLRTYF